jgi:ribosomal protein S18 acetylase RimI-like enzyme
VVDAVRLRCADAADVDAVGDVVRRAFVKYVPRIGREPMPMGVDYTAAIRGGRCWVAEIDGRIVGMLVIVPADGHLHLDTIAVAPEAQGRGVGGRLLAFADEQASAAGFAEVRLFTNAAMTENLAYYARHGYRETRRSEEHGFCRVFFTRRLASGERRGH